MALRTNSAGYPVRSGINDAAPFALCGWVKYHSLTMSGSPSTHGMAIYRGNDSDGAGAFGIRVAATTGIVQCFVPGTSSSPGDAVAVGAWHHYAVSRATSGTGSANYLFYLDGVLIATLAGTATDPAGATYGMSRDSVNGGYRCDISIRDFRGFPTAFADAAAVILEADSDGVAVKASPYFSEDFLTGTDFGTFTEGNSGTASTDSDEPDFDLGGGGGGITALLPLLLCEA